MDRTRETELSAALDAYLLVIEDQIRDDPEGALERIARAPKRLQNEPELDYLRGLARWRTEGVEAAREDLARAVERDPMFADARHALGDALGLLGDRGGMIAQWLEVRALDMRSDRGRGFGSPSVREQIAETAEAVLERLPEDLRGRLHNVPIVLEPRPSKSLVEDGFDPRALGLFEGPDDFGQRSVEAAASPSRIVLFYVNLEANFPEAHLLKAEVEVTILHELGHYFGLDEDGVEKLGLA